MEPMPLFRLTLKATERAFWKSAHTRTEQTSHAYGCGLFVCRAPGATFGWRGFPETGWLEFLEICYLVFYDYLTYYRKGKQMCTNVTSSNSRDEVILKQFRTDNEPTKGELLELYDKVGTMRRDMFRIVEMAERLGIGMSNAFCDKYPFSMSFDEVMYEVMEWEGAIHDKWEAAPDDCEL